MCIDKGLHIHLITKNCGNKEEIINYSNWNEEELYHMGQIVNTESWSNEIKAHFCGLSASEGMFTPSNLKNSKVRHISALKMRTILQQGDTHNAERVVRSYFKGRTGFGHAKQFSLCWKYLFSVGWCFSGWHDTPAPQGNQKQKN